MRSPARISSPQLLRGKRSRRHAGADPHSLPPASFAAACADIVAIVAASEPGSGNSEARRRIAVLQGRPATIGVTRVDMPRAGTGEITPRSPVRGAIVRFGGITSCSRLNEVVARNPRNDPKQSAQRGGRKNPRNDPMQSSGRGENPRNDPMQSRARSDRENSEE
jgi:hypothetical protein